MSRRWGYCGVIATEGDELLGYATMAPARMVPRLGALDAVHPINPDAAVLLSTRVEEPYRGRGLGRQLIQAAAGLMVRRDIRAIEAVGSYREGPSCVSPVDFLQRVGFSVIRQHPVTPRLRMDLQATARWLPHLGVAWNRLAGLMPQPAPGAEPAHRQAAGPRECRVDRGHGVDAVIPYRDLLGFVGSAPSIARATPTNPSRSSRRAPSGGAE